MLTSAFIDRGCTVPIQQAAMGGVATPELAAAVADAACVEAAEALEGDIAMEMLLGAVRMPLPTIAYPCHARHDRHHRS